ALYPHRHDDVFEVGIVGNRDQGRRIGIAQGDVYVVALQVVQHVEQVGDVKADIDAVAAIIDFDFFHRFFLVGVGGADLQAARRNHAAHTLELVGGHDRGTLQRTQQLVAVDGHVVAITLGNHAHVIRELAFHQLGNQLVV